MKSIAPLLNLDEYKNENIPSDRQIYNTLILSHDNINEWNGQSTKQCLYLEKNQPEETSEQLLIIEDSKNNSMACGTDPWQVSSNE